MKSILSFIFIFILSLTFGQKSNHKKIDSINNLPFEVRLKDAAILDKVYLKNAEESAKIHYDLGEAKSYSNLSLVYYYQGKYELAIIYLTGSLFIF